MNVFVNVSYSSIDLTYTEIRVYTYVVVIRSKSTIQWPYLILHSQPVLVITHDNVTSHTPSSTCSTESIVMAEHSEVKEGSNIKLFELVSTWQQ